MLIGAGEMVVFLVFLALVCTVGWWLWRYLRRDAVGPGATPALPARERAWLAESIARARWVAAHDEVEGQTRILLRRTYTGLDGRPVVLEERLLEAFPSQDPAWEAHFTEGMARARFRCSYLNEEESAG